MRNILNLKKNIFGGSETAETETISTETEATETAGTETTATETTVTETSGSETVVGETNTSKNFIKPLEENMFYKMFNNANTKFSETISNFVPTSLWMKLLLSIIISGVLLYIYNVITNWVKGTTTLLYDNCKMTSKGPRCSFSGNKKIEGNEGVYLIKTSYDKNIPITNDVSFYIYLNKFNKISLITDETVVNEENKINDYKFYDELIKLLNKGKVIYITPENQSNKKTISETNDYLNSIIFELNKLKLKSKMFIDIADNYREVLFKMKESLGYTGRNVKSEIKKMKKENNFGGKRVYDEVMDKSIFYENIIKDDLGFGTHEDFEYKTTENESKFDLIKRESENKTKDFKNKLKGIMSKMSSITGGKMKGGNIYNDSIKFKEYVKLLINKLRIIKSKKPSFNKKRLEWIIDSIRDKFIIKNKYNKNITLLYPDTKFSIKKFYGDKKLYERKLDAKNMFKSFKNLGNFVKTLKKNVLNIRDNYNTYYRIYYEDKTGKKYLQVNNSNNKYIKVEDKCSKNEGNIIYKGNDYKLCNPFILKLLCENNKKCKSIVQSHNPNYCMLSDEENIGAEESTLKYCEADTYFKQNIEKGYKQKNNFSDIVKFDILKNNCIPNWQLIKIGEL